MNSLKFDSSVSFDSPVGNINVFALGEKVVYLTMGDAPVGDSGRATVLRTAKKQLLDYFKGKSRELDFAVELAGTEFQRAVWHEISKLGWGQTATYADIAQAIGNPSAVRAVGGAVGANPVPLVVGCHRVLGASGKITGYSGGDGIPTKKWLLAHESIDYRD
jgi:methylated-DNA-[protein]-cysteine S-methyltransferase